MPEKTSSPEIVALIVAAGRGTRSGQSLPKQYVPVAGKPLLRRTIEALQAEQRIGTIAVVIHPGDRSLYDDAVVGLRGLLDPVPGGDTRQESVRLGLQALKAASPDIVLIHDAARPFVDAATTGRVIDSCIAGEAAIAALPVHETLKRSEDGVISGTVSRDALFSAQTPQGFPFAAILDAHEEAARRGETSLTDDAAVAAVAGLPVRIVAGDPANLKLTSAADFRAAETMVASRMQMETRTGQGFDVHAFAPGDSVIICGVTVPHTARLEGHSDADVGLHALTDAILGALADGDIGQHFPPSDPQWKGASSDRFLIHAGDLVRKAGGRIIHCDVTLICEAPKVGPHSVRMREAVAGMLGLDVRRVSVKATTSEKLGFTGRREGIASLATATIELPALP
ncbi:2-C-methyl-D-erythritol 2,4-cyclodiphosphate synthase [Faunimonas pinastri]|uniref:Bifunctional enzyme IspD/IspF n=1 Tax=Faunimonas pinastri TaxID=1855383 RepID=A0A1H9N801_9HYPH|nr:bifunctional 2-C-methyl-D-erythritol 4-phosphate cytidylyltransferase/2-C-methyl-D-erythritol 2,4-cyclodiphosphate synthase [Faunimonas pinastri]SER31789.1 2-C-methyl-D-erythritol 2,4-cyclodiphosphate synthase [Faunimonas pinastri]